MESVKNKNALAYTRKAPRGSVQKKILLLLWVGLAIGLSHSPGAPWKIARAFVKEFKGVRHDSIDRAVQTLYKSKLVSQTVHKDGSATLILTSEGKRLTLQYNLDTMRILAPKRWDGKWRLVTYDVPEDMRELRVELLTALKRLGFFELQHSVFVHPFECKNEIEFLIEAYNAREYVRRMTIEEIDSPESLLKYFKLVGK